MRSLAVLLLLLPACSPPTGPVASPGDRGTLVSREAEARTAVEAERDVQAVARAHRRSSLRAGADELERAIVEARAMIDEIDSAYPSRDTTRLREDVAATEARLAEILRSIQEEEDTSGSTTDH